MEVPLLSRETIMIVDDNPANLKVLEDVLRQQEYEVSAFPRGRLALTEAIKNPPDLILLDINMPEMSGYDVCARLKSDDRTSGIPVIFLSAMHDAKDKVKAFQSGAVDFISKPFQFEEVQARVETHLKLYALKLALKRQNERLEETVATRTRELAEANERLTRLVVQLRARLSSQDLSACADFPEDQTEV
jgi:response regulator RpfG family c-di-GMP phosphodiesterase